MLIPNSFFGNAKLEIEVGFELEGSQMLQKNLIYDFSDNRGRKAKFIIRD